MCYQTLIQQPHPPPPDRCLASIYCELHTCGFINVPAMHVCVSSIFRILNVITHESYTRNLTLT